ncbi:septation protein A [Phaeobacter gallaeciensis]|uniref:Inner membrane-spanning protein YciB n=2 Tax=Roseobacteraceae TaxID=2854170 RepID=A0A366X2T8_9RHOB|nr:MULTISPECIES: inner membrane-spanning protein YciB [Roseobacteraceae]MBT3143559.1 septation protein IspZ [Falsiruegeria litorea]MBT8167829.1 septation protein IspZ [Falsiruegeria litorea]RBW55631.1 septation protein A [Phaeobacter gallaeciensis]
MADKKDINPIMKQVLELGPTLAFFLLYIRIKENTYTMGGIDYSGFIVATLLFVPILLAAMGALWFLTGKLSRMQIFTAFMVIFFGGLTAWFNDERFFKMKTTLVYGFFTVTLGIGLLQGRSYLAFVLNEMLPMENEGWMILTRRLCLAFAVLAVANEVVWRTMSTDLWVKIETFGFPLALMAFLMLQFSLLQRYLIDPDQES